MIIDLPAIKVESDFLADVDAMLERTSVHVPMQEGLLQRIKVCKETNVTRFGVRLRGRM